MTKILNPGSVVYPSKFKPGDTAFSIKNVQFLNGKRHYAGQHILATPENCSYFNVNSDIYKKLNKSLEQEKDSRDLNKENSYVL